MKEILDKNELAFIETLEKQIIQFAKNKIPKEVLKEVDKFIYLQIVGININRIMDRLVKDMKHETIQEKGR